MSRQEIPAKRNPPMSDQQKQWASSDSKPAAGSYITDEVLAYLDNLRGHVRKCYEADEHQNAGEESQLVDTTAIQKILYEDWNKLSEKYFSHNDWPSAAAYKAASGGSVVLEDSFSTLYECLRYYRIYEVRQDQMGYIERKRAWTAFLGFFSTTLEKGPVSLPVEWLFDLVYSFVDQFQSYCLFRDRVTAADDTTRDPQVFTAENVMGVLKEIVFQSKITEALERSYQSFDTEDTLSSLGCFCLVGLSQLHLGAGDYHSTLKVTSHLVAPSHHDVVAGAGHVSGLLSQLDVAHALVKYQIAFSYLMSKRYSDASKVCESALSVLRSGSPRAYNKKLLQKIEAHVGTLDELLTALTSNGQRKRGRGHKGGGNAGIKNSSKFLMEMFKNAAPRFVNLAEPPSAAKMDPSSPAAKNPEGMTQRRQGDWFRKQIDQQEIFVAIRKILKMYQTVSLAKLGSFVLPNDAGAAEKVRAHLFCLKKQVASSKNHHDIHFYLCGDMVHVQDVPKSSHFGAQFVNQIRQIDNAIYQMEHRRSANISSRGGRNYRNNRR